MNRARPHGRAVNKKPRVKHEPRSAHGHAVKKKQEDLLDL